MNPNPFHTNFTPTVPSLLGAMGGSTSNHKKVLGTPETLDLLIPSHLESANDVLHPFDSLHIEDEELNKMLGLHTADSNNGTSTPAMPVGTKDVLAAMDGIPIASPIQVTIGSRKSASDVVGDVYGDSFASTSPQTTIIFEEDSVSKAKSHTPPQPASPASTSHLLVINSKGRDLHEDRKRSSLIPVTLESVLGKELFKRASGKAIAKASSSMAEEDDSAEVAKISAYARLDFEHFTFYVQTLQVILGRRSNDEASLHAVDVHLSSKKAISRKHAKIFYNFGTQRFELSVLGRNGAFVDDLFVEKGITVPLTDGTKIQIGDIPFSFVLPSLEMAENKDAISQAVEPFNPSDAINLRSSLYHVQSPAKQKKVNKAKSKDIEPETAEKKVELPTMDIEFPKGEIQSQSIPEQELISLSMVKALSTEGNLSEKELKLVEKHPSKELGKQGQAEVLPSRRKSSFTIPKDFKDMSASSRRNSLILQRRLSSSRRKSMNPGSHDEVGDILKELGINSIDEIGDVDPNVLDEQLLSILGEDTEFDHDSSIGLSAFNESAILEEDEESSKEIETKVKVEASKSQRNESLGLDLLDPELATLAPLIVAHNEELLREKQAKEKIQELVTEHPLMGRPANPLLGKPASIQPPPNPRLYGKPLSSISKPQLMHSGLNTSMVGHTLGNNFKGIGLGNLPMNLQSGLGGNAFTRPVIPPRPPPPKLSVAVNYISETHPRQSSYKGITVHVKTPYPSVCLRKSIEPLGELPKIPNRNKPMRKSKPTYNASEIPDMYKLKPNISYPIMITNVLSKAADVGFTISELHDAIRETYPYYKYCADGWQFSVNHNLRLSKNFKRLPNKKNNEWCWVIDESFIVDKEKARKKQQEIAAAKSKAAALRAEELKQKQRLEAQQAISNNIMGRGMASPFGISAGLKMPQSQFVSLLQNKSINGVQIPTSIAEMASQITRDGRTIFSTQGYFKPGGVAPPGMATPVGLPGNSAVFSGNLPPSIKTSTNIKAQLAANRAISSSKFPPKPASLDSKVVPGHGWSPKGQSPSSVHLSNHLPSSTSPTAPQPQPPKENTPKLASPPITSQTINQDTKKSLAYLQKELFVLYKARKLSYNTATTTEIITNALATTIAQVNAIGAKAGCGDNALNFLVEKAPQQVSKILDIALSKSIKEKQGTILSRQGTPGPQSPSTPATPKIASPSITVAASGSTPLNPSPAPVPAITSGTTTATPTVVAASIHKNGTDPVSTQTEQKSAVKTLSANSDSASGTNSAIGTPQRIVTPVTNSPVLAQVTNEASTVAGPNTPIPSRNILDNKLAEAQGQGQPSEVGSPIIPQTITLSKPALTTPKVEQVVKQQGLTATTPRTAPTVSTPGPTIKKPSYKHPGLSKPPVFSTTPKPPSIGSKGGSTFSQMAKTPLFLSNRAHLSTTPPAGTPPPTKAFTGRFASPTAETATAERTSVSQPLSPLSNKRKLDEVTESIATKVQKVLDP